MVINKEVNPRFEKTYKVYKHVFPNGKVYIGITSQSLDSRWNSGKGYGNNLVGKAIKCMVSRMFKGKPKTQEHRDKISAALKGRKRVIK